MHTFALYVSVALGAGWLLAECRSRPICRRLAGVLCIAWLLGVVLWQAQSERFAANHCFTAASKELLDASLQQLRVGRHDVLLREWSRASEAFGATYESRGDYADVVRRAVAEMQR